MKKSFKIILSLVILSQFIFIQKNVYALENAVDSFTYSSRNLLTYNYFYINGGADSASISVSYYNSSDTIYNSVVLCTDINYTSVTSSTSIVKNVQLLNTDYTCKFPNSNYSGGKVKIVNYQINGSSLSSPGTTSFFTFNQTSGGSLALIDFKISSTSYVNYKDYADTDVQIKNQQSLLNSLNVSQNKTNEKLDDLNSNQQQTNDKLDNLNSNLNDSDTSEATNSASDFFNGFTTDTFGLTSIITSPLTLIGSITSSTCSPLSLEVPFLTKNNKLNLPCMSSIYEENFGSFLTIYQTITFGIVAYWVCVKIFALVKEFKNPDSDKVEVLDL